MAYTYHKTITIDNTKVGGDEVDFPLAIVIASDNDLRTVGNGGEIQNTDATGGIIGNITVPADMVFSPNTDGSAPYDFEYEYYDATTGALIAHVRLPAMSSGVPTVLYMVYGDVGVVASQETIATVWDADYKAVHHKHGAGWAETKDSTANATDADQDGGAPDYQHASQIGYGIGYDGNDCVTLNGVLANIEGLDAGTFECWFKQEANGLNCGFFISDKDSNNDFAGMFIGAWTGDYADESLAWIVRRGGATVLYMVVRNGHDFYNDGDRHHVVVITGDGANRIIIDGVSQAITFASGAINTNEFTNINNPDTMWMAGRKIAAGLTYLTGELDEVRVSDSARSSNWAISCYNNQFSPGTFYSISAQQSAIVNRGVSQEGVLVEYQDPTAELDQLLPVLEVREAVYAELDQLVVVLEVFEPVRGVSQEGVFTEYIHSQRGVSQEGVLVDYVQPWRGVSQEGVFVEHIQPQRGVSQEGVLVEFDMPDDEGKTQIAGTSQIQPWSIHPDRLHPSVAGAGLAGGGPDGALRVDTDLYPPATAQGQVLVADATPAWTASLTPTWLGQHTFNAGLGIAAAQAITMGDEAYIGCGAADVRIVFDSGNDIALMGGNVGVGTLAAEAALHIAGGSGYDILLDNLGDLRWKNAGGAERLVMTYDAGNDLLIWNQGTDPDEDIYFGTKAVDGANIRLAIKDVGDIGVNTIDPDRLFHVEVADSATNSVAYAQRLSHITSNTAIAGFGVGLEFELEENDASNRVAAILKVKWSDAGETTNADGYFDFLTMLNDGAAASRMVVGYNGFVGINTAAPVYPLDVNGTVRTPIVHNAGAYDNQFAAGLLDAITVFGAYLDTRGRDFVGQEGWVSLIGDSRNVAASSGQIILAQYDGAVWNRRLTIVKGGLVGVGTPIPDCLLDLKQTSYDFVHFDRTGNANVDTIYRIGVSFSAANDDYIYITTTGLTASQGMVLTDDGWLGKGTDAPFGPFHVTNSPGSGMFTTADDVAAGAVTIVPNAAGDVAVTLSVFYAVSESGGGTDGGVVMVVNGASVDLYDDGTDILTLAVAADGSVTLQRTAGATTFDVSLWMVWL